MAGLGEDPGEGLAVLGRGRGREPGRQGFGRIVRPGHEELHLAAEQDRVVGPAHGGEEVRRGRRQGGPADPVADPLQGEVQRMRLVQRHLEDAGDDLHRAGEVEVGVRTRPRALGGQAAIGGDAFDQCLGRRLAGLEDEHGRGALVAIAELAEERLLGGPGPPRPGGEREIAPPLGLVGHAPAGILAGEAGQHRLGAVHGHGEGREGQTARREGDPPQAAHAQLGDQPPGLEPAARRDPGIDDQRPAGGAPGDEAEARRLVEQPAEQGCGHRPHVDRLPAGERGIGPGHGHQSSLRRPERPRASVRRARRPRSCRSSSTARHRRRRGARARGSARRGGA